MWKVGDIKIGRTRARNFFADGQGNQSKTEILYSSARYSEMKRDIDRAIKGENPAIDKGTNAIWAKIGCGAILTVLWSPEVGWGRPNSIS